MTVHESTKAVHEEALDHFSADLVADPYEEWQRRRDLCPVHHSDIYGGFYFIPRYDDVWKVLTDQNRYSATDGSSIPSIPVRFIPLNNDPPEQRAYRRLVDQLLAPQALQAHEPWIRSCAVSLLEPLQGQEEFDFSQSFAKPFPAQVIFHLLGMSERLHTVEHWCETIMWRAQLDPEGAGAATGALHEYIRDFLDQRRSQPANGDLTSALLNGSFQGRPLTEDELLPYMVLLLFGGLHTTGSVLAWSMTWLADHPEGRDALRADPGLLPTAIEEFLRLTHPAAYVARTVKEPTEVAGCPLRPGDRVMLGIGSANRDPQKFEDPEHVHLDRSPNPHLTFGAGIHRCVGAHLGKLEIKVAVEEILARFGDFSISDRSRLTYTPGEMRGLEAVPIRVDG